MFCLKYYPAQSYFKDVQELKIIYQPADRTLADFLEKYQDKSIVIVISSKIEEMDIKLLKGLSDKYHNIRLSINFNDKDLLSLVQESNIPYFFINSVTTIDQLYGLLKYNPTDMYICEELGFSLQKISKILHDNNIKVRVYPNICQSSFSDTPSIKTFFIRPEDIDSYSNFVDIFEIVADKSRQSILYKIYKQQKWFGKIQDIIPSYKGDLDSRYILSTFGTIRSVCGKRCMYKPGSCTICDCFLDLSETLKENKIAVQGKMEKIDF